MKSVNLLPPENSSDDYIAELAPQNPYKKALIFMGVLIFLLAIVLIWSLYKLHITSKEKTELAVSRPIIAPPEPAKPIKQPKPPTPVVAPTLETPATEPTVIPIKPITVETPKVEIEAPKVEVKPVKPVEPAKVQPLDQREYSLLLGTFNAREAKKKVDEIAKFGLTPQQKKVKVSEKAYLVYVERVSNYELAQNMEKQLQKDGFDTYLSSDKNPNDGFRVRTGVFTNRGNAKDLLNKLKAKGYSAQIETSQLNIAKYEVKIGAFPTYQAAKSQQNNLQAKGIKTVLLMKQMEN
ncbi:MAG: SPOR domain-containing protein [Candidatus Schekmanbacteria bacterium]|nr:SPOR domain-containing protein [Candidatus Schekmanbacteria bacterium]